LRLKIGLEKLGGRIEIRDGKRKRIVVFLALANAAEIAGTNRAGLRPQPQEYPCVSGDLI
jgi:hypothetical protein